MTRSPIYAFILACIRVHALICETTEHLTLSFFTSLLPYTNRLKKKNLESVESQTDILGFPASGTATCEPALRSRSAGFVPCCGHQWTRHQIRRGLGEKHPVPCTLKVRKVMLPWCLI